MGVGWDGVGVSEWVSDWVGGDLFSDDVCTKTVRGGGGGRSGERGREGGRRTCPSRDMYPPLLILSSTYERDRLVDGNAKHRKASQSKASQAKPTGPGTVVRARRKEGRKKPIRCPHREAIYPPKSRARLAWPATYLHIRGYISPAMASSQPASSHHRVSSIPHVGRRR